jgi:hypothetical protein
MTSEAPGWDAIDARRAPRRPGARTVPGAGNLVVEVSEHRVA